MKSSAEIIIIGGGISGTSIGYFLMKHGAKNVVILEKHHLAWGGTGRCGAGIRQQWGSEMNCIMAKYSCEFYENANEELKYEGDIEFKQGGYLMLIATEKEREQTEKNVQSQNTLGINSRLVSVEECKEIAPLLNTEEILAGAFYEKDGHLNPFHTTQAFADAFVRLGGEIYKNTSVTDILVKSGKVRGVVTNQGEIKAPIVINAAGGYSQIIAEMAGFELPVHSERHNILVTEPVDAILNPMIMGFSLNLYCQQVPHGGFIMGRTCADQPKDYRVTSDSSFPENMAKTIVKLLPALKNVRMLRQWAGLYNVTPDNHMIYDQIPGVSGFYAACGFSGHGFMMAPATGQSMAEMVLGLPATLPWHRFNLARFNEGALLIEPSVV